MTSPARSSVRGSGLRQLRLPKQKIYAVIAVSLFLVASLLCFSGYVLEKQLYELQRSLRTTDQLRIVKSASPKLADRRVVDNFVGVRCPSWIPGVPVIVHGEVPFTRFILCAPYPEVEDVQLRFADVNALKTIAEFRHLRCVKLVRLRTESHDGMIIDCESLRQLQGRLKHEWSTILQRPLTRVCVIASGVPDNICQLLAERGTVKSLTILNEKALVGVSSLSKCQGLEELVIGDICSLEDDDVRQGISKSLGLKVLSLTGSQIGSGAISAAFTLPALEDLHVAAPLVDAAVYKALTGHKSLRVLAVPESSATPAVLEGAASIPTLKVLIVSRNGPSKEQVASFESGRPDVKLHLVDTFQ